MRGASFSVNPVVKDFSNDGPKSKGNSDIPLALIEGVMRADTSPVWPKNSGSSKDKASVSGGINRNSAVENGCLSEELGQPGPQLGRNDNVDQVLGKEFEFNMKKKSRVRTGRARKTALSDQSGLVESLMLKDSRSMSIQI
ncbi:hypothetical protein NE237_011007 [Protea cynaroides]|uniref:Uncharacterized protein n=1 Tax=Protea cynaroides TaxID=273540 RepID=A0A9Q0L0G5_9MAGN|nr:hypothetical protein NE237_011007 [Protea cynaroides]